MASAILNLQNFDFLSNIRPGNWNLYLLTKFYLNRIIHSWDIEIKLFSKWRPSAILGLRKLPFWSRDLYRNVILHLNSKFRINRPIWRRDIAKNDFQYGVRPPSWICKNFDFLLNVHPGNWNVHLRTKFDRNRIIRSWDMEIMLFSKWRQSAILNLRKLQFLVTYLILASDSSSPFQISGWSANMAPRCSQKRFSVRHLGFVMTSSYCIRKLHFTFATSC